MSTVRDSATVTVIRPVDGSRRVKARRRGGRTGRVESYRIHASVLRAALKAADGDPRRLDWSGAALRDGVITMIRVLNEAPTVPQGGPAHSDLGTGHLSLLPHD